MPENDDAIRKAAAALGRKGGQSRSDAKVKAVRENGKKGGRPKKPAKFGDEKPTNQAAQSGAASEGKE
jgi:hypothetical protein